MKIAILGFTKIKYMPYMHFYLNQIDVSQNDVHLIYWKRDESPDSDIPEGVCGHSYDYLMSDAIPLSKKIPGIIKYGRFAKKTIKELAPDFLIVLHSTTAISIYGLLKGKYKNRYIFDYRDVTYEHISVYKKMVGNIVNNSVLSFTSSGGFRKFLPDTDKLLTSHNITNVDFREKIKDILPRKQHGPIRVAYWGLLRHHKLNEAIIEKLGGDDRFELHYYGRAQGSMLSLVKESSEKYNNVFFHGEYAPKDRLEMAKNTDMIHNMFDINDRTMPIAMSNKYYDGPLFALPQLCAKGSLMGSLCTKYGVGLECDPLAEDFADKVYEYYISLDEDDFLTLCDKELARVLDEVAFGNKKIKEVLQNA